MIGLTRRSAAARLSAFVIAILAVSLLVEVVHAGVRKEVRFGKGASGTVIEGAVIRGERDRYVIGAAKGQYLSIKVESPENNAVVDVYSPGAQEVDETNIKGVLLPNSREARSVALQLPATGQYLLVVGGTRGNAEYRLSVSVTSSPPESRSAVESTVPAPIQKQVNPFPMSQIVDEAIRCRPNPSMMNIYYFAGDRTVSLHSYLVNEGKTQLFHIMGGRYLMTEPNTISTQFFGLYDGMTKQRSVKAGPTQQFRFTATGGPNFTFGTEPCTLINDTPETKRGHDLLRKVPNFLGPG